MGCGGVTTTALAALDIALWDLVAKEVRKPLVAVLGPCRERILAYASGINLNKPLDDLLEQAKGWKAMGFKAFKIKVGKPDIDEDVERLTRVREIVGPRPLMVDANQGWDIAHAARAINAYAPLDPYWVEEPLLCDDVEGHARLRGLVRAPIAIGENVYTIQQFNHFLARAWNVPLAPHFMMELSGQVLCALPNAHILENIDGGSLTDLKALEEPILIEDGWFTPPSGRIGHGIAFDRGYLRAHEVR
jgi:L-alanine-DL-glutamate epimerase-like enolase superfamily enzyme